MTKNKNKKKLSDLWPLRQVQVSDMKPLYCPGGSSAAPAPHTAVASGSPAPAPWKHKKGKKKSNHLHPKNQEMNQTGRTQTEVYIF